jgi:colanic acid/amylovoran biosynthesis glycosyltransferase
MELPVVASDLGGVSEGLVDGETGYLVTERDIEGITRFIRLLHDDPERRGMMGRAGRAFVAASYGIPESTRQMFLAYARVSRHG